MKLLLSLIVLLCSLTIALPAFAGMPVDSELLSSLLAEAEIHNPALQAAREAVDVAASRIDQVSALPDPMLSISLMNYPIDTLRNDKTPMTGNDFKLSQMFPFPGKLATKRELAHQHELWAKAKYEDLVLQVRQQVRDTWFKLSFQRQAIGLIQTNMKLMDDFIRLTEARYQVGKGLQQNVLKAQVERSRLLDRLLGLQQDAENSKARINSLVGRPTEQSLADIDEPVEVSYTPSLENLRKLARQNRPMFGAFDALIGQSEQKGKLAKLDYRPDFTVWAGYRFRADDLPDKGTDFVSGGVSLNLPFPNAKRRAAVREADASLRMAHQQRNEFTRQVDLALHNGLTDLQQAQQLVKLYRGGIIPQAEQTYKATLSAYQVDKVDFLTLTDSLMTVYRFRIDLARAESDVQRSAARLLATTGLDDIAQSISPSLDR
ncbi:TolC family protein [Geopsychrobacter electrodiphilus]|uniref:TolC family protein n=1 Tax=Geopsychrobacter electrodiphilus TaxID=225196 RepID=UPI00036EE427|nr:TolC family protein [Geopsychrobacter electrodiphilus]